MDLILEPRSIAGTVAAIASKSQAHRLLICAALAERPTRILCGALSQDIEATARCLAALGAGLCYDGAVFTVRPIGLPQSGEAPDCGESGSTLRFLLPVAAALGCDATFHLRGRLPERPLGPLWEALEAHGCRLTRPTPDTLRCAGQLRGGVFALAGNVSSQFLSGLLFALPLTGEDCRLRLTTPLESRGYVDLTLAALERFGIRVEAEEAGWRIPGGQRYRSPGPVSVEGDWSNAAFWLCAGAVSGPVTVTGLDMASRQGDRAVLAWLRALGAEVEEGTAGVTVRPGALHGCAINAREIPDLVPPLALTAALARGETCIYGAARLRFKESDRLQTVADTLNALGGRAEVRRTALRISGGALRGGAVSGANDHRIVMMAAVAAAVALGRCGCWARRR